MKYEKHCEQKFDFVRVQNIALNIDRKVLMILVDKATFVEECVLENICSDINSSYSKIDGNSIVIVFAVNDNKQLYAYKGNKDISTWLSKRKYNSNQFLWTKEFPDIKLSPREIKV